MAAVLFGISAPLSKMLLDGVEPVMLAALLYLGSGFGLLFAGIMQKFAKHSKKEAALVRKDIPWLAGAILAGGVAAPIILMISLENTPAATASLLLNFEGVATSLIAVMVFKEALGRQIWAAVAFIALASIILTWDAKGHWGVSTGAAGVMLACFFWGMDNNFTRNISAKSPLSIVTLKGISAGMVSLVIALSAGNRFPGPKIILAALVLGFLSYGTSIFMFVFAMRSLGAARTSAFFGSAPFVGAIVSLIIFRERPGINLILSLPFMIAGAILILREDHSHLHIHEMIEHEHRHAHDDNHHVHEHAVNDPMEHVHPHMHESIEHSHSHNPDIHHRHVH